MKAVQPESPLVSCVMATTQPRRPFLRQALKYFLRQSYSPKELIVVDDPGTSAFDLTCASPVVRYLQPNVRLTLGSKLNLGIQEARGTIIQKLDDDDYYHPEFLAATVGALCARNRVDSIVACKSCLVLIAATGELKWRSGVGTMFAGGTFCFYRELWQRCPFRDARVAADKLFLEDHEPERIGIDNPELYIYVRHGLGHLWSHFLRSEQKDEGPVMAGDDVTEYLRRLPTYSRSLKQCIPEEDLWFYESQVDHCSDTLDAS